MMESFTDIHSDTHVLPPEVEKVFRRVQDSAHYMPNWQMEVRLVPYPLYIKRETDAKKESDGRLPR